MQVVALIDEEDGRFGVAFPDFPGCTTVATSLDEAVTLTEGHPHVKSGGSIEVCETMPIPM